MASFMAKGRSVLSVALNKRSFMHRSLDYLKANEMVKVMGIAESRRYLLKKDGLGYSMHYTIIGKDSSMYIHYKHHQESCLCVQGSLEIELVEPMADAGTGKEVVKVEAGDAYIFDGHESHYLKGGPDGAHIVCIFTPACTGMEKTQEDGSFPLLE